MNCDEVYQIKKTWEIPAATPTDSGVAILTTFFTRYPSNLQKFKKFENIPINDLKTNARFKAHSTNIIKVFDESVQSLGHDWSGPKLDEIWSNIAKTHFKRKIEKQSYMQLREIILEVLTHVCNLNEKQTAAWEKLLDIVYSIIFNTVDQFNSGAEYNQREKIF